MVVIGSNYRVRKDELKELIRDCEIDFLVHQGEDYTCYFCLQPIQEKAYELILGETSYFVDSCCFGEARFTKR